MDWHLDRIPKALLITVLAGSLLGGAVGFVAADDDSEPVGFIAAEPRIGDQWQVHYTRTATMAGEPTRMEFDVYYTWSGIDKVVDGQGREREAVLLHEEILMDPPLVAYHHYDIVTRQPIVSALDLDAPLPSPLTLASALGAPGTSSGELSIAYQDFLGRVAPCGATHGLQGALVQAPSQVNLTGYCGPVATPTWDVTSSSAEGQVLSLQQAEGAVELDLGLPVPTRVEAKFSDSRFVTDEVHVLELSAFVRGTEPWPLEAAAPGPGHAPLTTAPVTGGGLVDAGLEHPYTLAEAHRDLTERDEQLARFLSEHPAAKLVGAGHLLHQETTRDLHRWALSWSDGEELAVFVAQRVVYDERTPVNLVLETANQDREQFGGGLPIDPVDPSCVPDRLPPLAAMADRYAQHSSGPIISYGWQVDPDCSVSVSIGRNIVRYDPFVPFPLTTFEVEQDILEMDGRGDIRVFSSTGFEWGFAPRATTGVPGESPEGSREPLQSVTHRSEVVWVPPPAETVVTLGALGLALGAIYWSWPSLKLLPLLSMFSRIRKDDLLDHPIRAALMDQVQGNPGIHYQALVKELGKGRGVIEHHLRKLETGGLVQAKRSRGYTCYFALGALDNRVMDALPAIKAPTAVQMLRGIIDRPGVTAKELAAALGISPSTASHHLARLRTAGLVEGTGGRNVQLLPTSIAHDALRAKMT